MTNNWERDEELELENVSEGRGAAVRGMRTW
jgi:hypothetical protein